MTHKTVIGSDDSRLNDQARTEQARADQLNSEYVMMQRRIRTFHNELSYVKFDADAPAWAEAWLGWLLTGVVPTPEVEEVVADEVIEGGSLLEDEAGAISVEQAEINAEAATEETPTA